MTDIREEARAEAERRWPDTTPRAENPVYPRDAVHYYNQGAFAVGAVWADARKVEVTELIGLLASYGEYVEVETAIQHVREWSAALGGGDHE